MGHAVFLVIGLLVFVLLTGIGAAAAGEDPVALVVGVLGLVNFPHGIAIGIYTFWMLTQPGAVEDFHLDRPIHTPW